MANLMRVLAVLGAVCLWGCGARLPFDVHSANPGNVDAANSLSGLFTRVDQTAEDLSRAMDKPVVLIFSQSTCLACAHEADDLLQHLTRPTENPSRVHVFTVLAGAILDDAIHWLRKHPVPWIVGVDPDSMLFKRYCAVHTVPCVIVYTPARGVVLKENGPMTFEELTELTGEWED